MSRCTGHCCESFPLQYPPERIQEEGHKFQDGEIIKDMVIHLGHGLASTFRGYMPPEGDYEADFYTCRHFDKATRNCGIYDTRPRMCSEYPYGRDCSVAGCTRDHAVADPISPARLAWLALERRQATDESAA